MPLTRRAFAKLSLSALATAATAGVGTLAYAYNVEPDLIEVVPLSLTLPRLSPAFHGYRLVQISDIHMGTGMTPERLERIIDLVNEQQPDLVAITGDFVTHQPLDGEIPPLVAALRRLNPVNGTVAVLGNHDYFADPKTVRRALHESGIIELSNAVHTLRRGRDMLHLAGVDTPYYHHDRLDEVLAVLPDEGAAVLLAHEPDFADTSAASGRFDLQLSGHSHGGQIRLPGFDPLALPRLCRNYPEGLYQVNGMYQYTNRGLGTVIVPIRINCRPEITVFTLESPA